GNPDGTYFQPFTPPVPRNGVPVKAATLDGPSRLVFKGPLGQEIALKEGIQFKPAGLGASGRVCVPAVFAGYGITMKTKDFEYDDYAGLDVEDKVVVILRDVPRFDSKSNPFGGQQRRGLGSLNSKLTNAEKHGAAAVLFVNDADTASTGDDLLDF